MSTSVCISQQLKVVHILYTVVEWKCVMANMWDTDPMCWVPRRLRWHDIHVYIYRYMVWIIGRVVLYQLLLHSFVSSCQIFKTTIKIKKKKHFPGFPFSSSKGQCRFYLIYMFTIQSPPGREEARKVDGENERWKNKFPLNGAIDLLTSEDRTQRCFFVAHLTYLFSRSMSINY